WSTASFTMMPVVWSLSPASCFFSSTVTRSPARASACALASPAKLAPTTTQSEDEDIRTLVGHRVEDVVDERAHALRRELCRIRGIVGVLDRVAEIHVVADRHHDPALVVVDPAPVRHGVARLFVGEAGLQEARAGHLLAAVEIPERVEDLVLVRYLH